ncbi:Uncharacterised protein [Shigella sonnei]|nr:Uncharacterised protein [Shigella sonnei]
MESIDHTNTVTNSVECRRLTEYYDTLYSSRLALCFLHNIRSKLVKLLENGHCVSGGSVHRGFHS